MGGSKAPQRAAKDAAANAQFQQAAARDTLNSRLTPYLTSGEEASNLLADYLGIGIPEGYAPKPTLQKFIDMGIGEHFAITGRNFDRSTPTHLYRQKAEERYQQALQDWEKGLSELPANSRGSGRLLKDFSNEDFVKDPGYEFRLAEGEKGTNRALAARGSFDSGAALKSLERFRQDYASNEFGNAYNRDAANKSRIYDFLSNTANAGQNAVGTSVGITQNAANNISNIGTQTAQQVGQMQQDRNMTFANAIQSGIGNLIYGVNRPRDSGVTSTSPWQTPPFNPSYNQSAGNTNWWNQA
jgi:hypothetical protein